MDIKLEIQYSTHEGWRASLKYEREGGSSFVTGFHKDDPAKAAAEAMEKLMKGQVFKSTF